MPIYEYQCPKCTEVREVWQSIYDTDPMECSNCEVPMQKLISKSAFQLKGGGWYADGYCKKKEDIGSEKKPSDSVCGAKTGKNEKSSCTSCNV
jgi:putative FmdB family regulatory protein